jgi:hypothetical protein
MTWSVKGLGTFAMGGGILLAVALVSGAINILRRPVQPIVNSAEEVRQLALRQRVVRHIGRYDLGCELKMARDCC